MDSGLPVLFHCSNPAEPCISVWRPTELKLWPGAVSVWAGSALRELARDGGTQSDMGVDYNCQRLYFVWGAGHHDRRRPGLPSGMEREGADLDIISGRGSGIFTEPLCRGAL